MAYKPAMADATNTAFAATKKFAATHMPEMLVMLIAATTRFWRLGYHSIWFDEAISLKWATSDPVYTWQKTFALIDDKHPPLYYISLHYWQQGLYIAGLAHNDAALRAFGSLLGVLTVWGIMVLAARLSGRATGLLTGLLTALAPVLIWYSQELRMFQPATTWIVWAALCLIMAWQADRVAVRLVWWAGLVLSLTFSLYSYLFSAFILPAAGLTLLLLSLKHHRWRRFAEGVASLTVVTLLYAPLAFNAWSINAADGERGHAFSNFTTNLHRLLQIFTVWRVEWSPLLLNGYLVVLAIVILAGVLVPFTRSSVTRHVDAALDRSWLALWISVPLLVANLLLISSNTIFAEDRYLIFLAPFVLWALARGIVVLGQRWPLAGRLGGGGIVLLFMLALPHLWTPASYRENWRATAAYILAYEKASSTLPGAIVTHVDYTHYALDWYIRQQADREQLPIFDIFGGTVTPEAIDSTIAPRLEGIAKIGKATLWLTQSHLHGVDDGHLMEDWLNRHYPIATEQYPTGIKLTGYMLRYRYAQLPDLGSEAIFPNAEVAPGLKLAACEIMTPNVHAHDQQMHPPSGWVHLRLWWRATHPLQENYTATAQIMGQRGIWGDRLVRSGDTLSYWPTSNWPSREYVREEMDVNINPLTPKGNYPVMIGMDDPTGRPSGPHIECGQVEVN